MLNIINFFTEILTGFYTCFNFKLPGSPVGFIDFLLGCSLICIMLKFFINKKEG